MRQLTSFDIYVIVSELQQLIGNNIDKIYQLTQNEFIIKVKNINTKNKENIFIRNGELICFTKKDFKAPLTPSVFAMTLRKYLQNGKITDITQHEFDRIIKFKIARKEGEYSLIIEFFSTGNIILVDPEGKIILPLIKQTWAHRKIRGRELYIPPPPQTNPFNITKEKFIELLKASESDIVRTLAVSINLSGHIAEEICARVNIDKNKKITEIQENTINSLYDEITEFLKIFKEKKFTPVIVKKDEKIIDVTPIKFEIYKSMYLENIESFVGGLENFIELKKVEKTKDIDETEKLLGKLNRQLLQQQEAIKKLVTEIESKKLEGDLIYLNYQELDNLLKKINSDNIFDIRNEQIVKEFNPEKNLLIVNLKDTKSKIFEIKINFRKTVSENAEKAYDECKKLKNKFSGTEKSIKKTKELIEQAKLKKQDEKQQEEKTINEKKEKLFWFERFRWFIASGGNLVIGGKDEKTNDLVVKKYLKEGDRYAHADVQGAPSIIIKNKGFDEKPIDISIKTLEQACIFAASYSKAWKQFAEAQTYWVLPEQVSKTPEAGEFLPRGSFIIRGKRNYFRCKLELAVGEIELQGYKKIMAGPVEAVEKISKKYVIIIPGETKKIDIAHILARAFEVTVDEVDRVLPPGGITINKTVGLKLKRD